MTNGATTTDNILAVWTVSVYINQDTTITQVLLPFYQRNNPKQHAKHVRDSILKLITGMNGDINPLNFRSDKKLDGTIDIFYPFAPGWTTLSGGWRPTITLSPYKIASMVVEACEAVPMVKDVVLYLLENGKSKEIGLEELAVLNIPAKPVPNLHGESSSTSTSTTNDAEHARELRLAREEAARSATEAQALREQVDMQAKHADELRMSLEQLRAEIKELSMPNQAAMIDEI